VVGIERRERAGVAADRQLSPALQGLAAFGIYLVIWVLKTVGPLVLHPASAQLDQTSPDPNFYVWSLRWWPYAIGHGLNPLFSSQIGAPAGHSLAWVTTVPPLSLLSAPLTLVAGPVVAFNLLTAIALPVSAWAAFVLCRRLTGRFWPALAGGAVFGFSAYESMHTDAGQLNILYSLLLPILAYLVLRWHDKSISARTFVILAGIVVAIQFYLFLETFADMTALVAVSLLIGFALAGQAGRPTIKRLAGLVGIAYAVALVLAAPYLAYALTEKPPVPLPTTGLDLASLVIPRPGRTFGISWLTHAAADPRPISAGGYIGVPLLALVILLAVAGWSCKLVRFLTCMLAAIIVASIGPVLYLEGHQVTRLPWARLYDLPLVRNAYPARLMLFAFLVLAVVAALYLAGQAGLDSRSGESELASWAIRPALRWPLALLVIAAIALDASPIHTRTSSSVPAYISAAQYKPSIRPGEIVLVLSSVRNAGMLWQADSDFAMRLGGGFINSGFSKHSDQPQVVKNLAHPTPANVAQFEAYIKASGVGAILLDARHAPLWVGILPQIGLVGHRVGNVEVYLTDGCRTCRLLTQAQLSKLPRVSA
jgi:hypothetical protein